jgi:hypothetical protein
VYFGGLPKRVHHCWTCWELPLQPLLAYCWNKVFVLCWGEWGISLIYLFTNQKFSLLAWFTSWKQWSEHGAFCYSIILFVHHHFAYWVALITFILVWFWLLSFSNLFTWSNWLLFIFCAVVLVHSFLRRRLKNLGDVVSKKTVTAKDFFI